MIAVKILGTGSALPERRVATQDLLASLLPGADAAAIEERIGIHYRHWLGAGETAAGLAAQALGRALEAAGLPAEQLRRLILVTSTGGDQMIPATAHGVADALGIRGGCDAFDMNNSCAGFLNGLDLAARLVATGGGPVGVVAVETFSRLVSPEGRRAYVVLGDAAAGAIIGPARSAGEGVLASVLECSSALRGKMVMPHPGRGGGRSYHDFDTTGPEIALTAVNLMEKVVAAALTDAGVGMQDIAWVLPHQPNGEIFRIICDRLRVPETRVVPVYPDAGSLGAASVPLSLDRLMRDRPVRPGDRILLAAVGSGTSSGAIVYQVGR
jgi:3-oxoacyl-(acyl-carrier-protein) synthase III